MAELFDTHAHLDYPQFDRDREDVISRAAAAGVRHIITIGSGGGLDCQEAAIAIANSHEKIRATVGVHPHDAKLMGDDTAGWLKGLASADKVVAIGEIGLDYAKKHSPADVQLARFREQLALARELDMPVVIHDREAHEDLMRVVKDDGVPKAGGIMHCFPGSVDMALELVDMGFYISFPGVITFKNAKDQPKVAAEVPLERILIETDCPFLAPHPHRGKRNEPAYVKYVAEAIAGIRGTGFDDVARATTDNAFRAFRLR